MIPLQIGDLIQYHIDSLEKITSWPIPTNSYNKSIVQELIFSYDDYIKTTIDRAITLFNRSAVDIDLLVINVNQCTKEDIKQFISYSS